MATILYTSGTTKNPKGAVLLHKNFIAQIPWLNPITLNHMDINSSYLSYLPLAHVYERVATLLAFMRGWKIFYYWGDMTKLI